MSLPNPIPVASVPPHPVEDARVHLLRSLLADRDWTQSPILRARLQHAAALLRNADAHPLDEATWLLVADETARYLDFRRLRSLEAQLQGCAPDALHYTRADWEAARTAEAALESHLRHVRFSSYVPEPVPMFRIH